MRKFLFALPILSLSIAPAFAQTATVQDWGHIVEGVVSARACSLISYHEYLEGIVAMGSDVFGRGNEAPPEYKDETKYAYARGVLDKNKPGYCEAFPQRALTILNATIADYENNN